MKLFEIKSEYEAIMSAIEVYAEENEGEIPDSLDNMLEMIEDDHQIKMVSCACIVKNCNAEAVAIKEILKPLQKRVKALENKAEAFKRYMSRNAIHGVKITAPEAAISWRKSKSVDIIDESKVPEDYCKVIITPSKTAIKKAIESGVVVPGAAIVEKLNLQIK